MSQKRKLVETYLLLPKRDEKHALVWEPHLGNALRAQTVTGEYLTVRFFNTAQRDSWLRRYNGSRD